jgi:hypothetical protein
MSVVRQGDLFASGGIVTAPCSTSVTVNGRPVALQGAVYTPHLGCTPTTPQHCFGVIFDMPAGVTIEGQTPITKGGKGICGHSPSTASTDVIIVGGGFGPVGALLSMGAGKIDFGTSELGGLASGFSDAASSVTGGFDAITSSFGSELSGLVGGGELGKIVGSIGASVISSTAKSVVTAAIQKATSKAA